MSKADWDEVSRSVVCESYDDFAWLRATIEKLCSDHPGMCQAEVKQRIARFNARASAVEARLRRRTS